MSVVESCENVQQLKYRPKRLQQTSWVQHSARIVLLGEPVMGRLVDDVMYVGVAPVAHEEPRVGAWRRAPGSRCCGCRPITGEAWYCQKQSSGPCTGRSPGTPGNPLLA